jgi:hypothetical protein
MIGPSAGARLDTGFPSPRKQLFRSGMLAIFDSRSATPNKRGNHESMQRREFARRRGMRDADVERLRASQQRYADGVESRCKFRKGHASGQEAGSRCTQAFYLTRSLLNPLASTGSDRRQGV